jgi:hypothetical protein
MSKSISMSGQMLQYFIPFLSHVPLAAPRLTKDPLLLQLDAARDTTAGGAFLTRGGGLPSEMEPL